MRVKGGSGGGAGGAGGLPSPYVKWERVRVMRLPQFPYPPTLSACHERTRSTPPPRAQTQIRLARIPLTMSPDAHP